MVLSFKQARHVLAKHSVFSCLLFTVPVGSARLVPGMSSLQQGWFNEKPSLQGSLGSPHALLLPVSIQ